ncbi:carbohydrate-binding protein [Microbacterium sp. CFH 90308]|uniref:Carbohydrate-binding protein n=1 Tax=Microbacterium salsuginis TaxID=2722803 RepID=A0ABX1KCV0_9MICO|nr:fibronectin type III domain-containing protein [Microbacterium sp. CFH 90308]NLP84190.1 carbohydrate-binding protein [Microbacterium sp. CFH 90308]
MVSLIAGSAVATAAFPAVAAPQITPAAITAAAEPLRLEGEQYTSGSNPNGEALKRESINLGNTFNGTVVQFDDVDFTNRMGTLTVRAATRDDAIGANPRLEFFLDEAIAANKIADVALPTTGGWSNWLNTTVDLSTTVTGVHDVIIVMHVDDLPDRRNYVANFDYFEFGPAAPVALPEAYLTSDSPWKYSDNGTDPSGDGSLSWTTAPFDDTAWKEAAGAFGSKRGAADLGNGYIADTLLQYAQAGSADTVPTYHFRTEVTITAEELEQLDALQGELAYDDAVRVFVNGEKLAGFADDRVNGAANQNLTYAGVSAGDPATSTVRIPADKLVAGENQIAVALYQDRETSSDIFLDFKGLTPVEKQDVTTARISDLLLGVGATAAERNLAWYSDIDVPQVAQLTEASAIIDGVFPATASTFPVTSGGATSSGEFFRDATLSGLEENTEYAYRVGADETGWSTVHTFRTQSFTGGFDFLFFGDPQVGASGNLANDEAGWIDTLNVASQTYPNAEMLFSAGDQVESAGNENEYTALLKPDQMRSIPFVATNGNHDVGSKAYEQHYNLPNEDLTAGAAGSPSSSGGDYWFIYKDVLFLNINSNSRDYASHNAFLEKVVAEQGDKVTWKVLAFHHSIYSAAVHATDGDVIDRRNNMPAKISELGIDMVLMGHDHHYTRSYLIKDGQLANPDEQAAAAEVVAGPGEVLYVTANSASGSKYYNLNTGIDLWWSSVRNQERVRNYSAVEVTDESITVRTLRSQANGTANPVNSVVDEVVLRKADAAADLDVSVSASTRVLAGKQYVSVTVTNNEDVPVDAVVTTPYGAKTFTAVAPGKSAAVSINSRLGSIPAGDVTVQVTGQVGDETVTVTKSAPYAAAG